MAESIVFQVKPTLHINPTPVGTAAYMNAETFIIIFVGLGSNRCKMLR